MALAMSPIKTPANSKIIHPKFSPKSFENILSIGTGHGEQLMRAPPTKSLGKRVTDVTKGGTNDSVDQLFYLSQSSPSLHHPIQ